MLLPITGKVDITASMIFFAGIYYGAMYGGSTTSILLNTPGETSSMVTALEGNKMAKSGRAGAALATAAIGSFVAGTIATVIVTLFAPTVAEQAVKLGPPEYFLLMVLAFTTVSAVLGQSTLRGMTSLFLGLALGLIGLDQISGQARYTGGVPELLDGIEIVLVAVGLFAVAEILYFALFEGRSVETQNKMSRVYMSGRDWRRSVPAWLRATFIGAPFGCIPAGGTEIPTYLSYAVEKKLAKGEDKEEFGTTGAIEGVAGPEAANNATVTTGADSAADPGHPDVQHHRHPAGRLPELRHPAGAAAVHDLRRVGLGADRVAVHRQRDAADPEPAAGEALGAAAEDPEAAALRGNPDLRHGRRLRHAPERLRPGPAVGDRPGGPADAPLRLPDRAGGGRHDPRPAGGSADAQRGIHRRGQLRGVRAAPGVYRPAGDHPDGAAAAADHQADAGAEGGAGLKASFVHSRGSGNPIVIPAQAGTRSSFPRRREPKASRATRHSALPSRSPSSRQSRVRAGCGALAWRPSPLRGYRLTCAGRSCGPAGRTRLGFAARGKLQTQTPPASQNRTRGSIRAEALS
jgi:hypothetical protein